MAKRISDIAKELGVPSKAIIDKCLSEGVPSDKVKGHMSTISAGLEASIREWFSQGGVATAIETGEHLDVDKVKTKAPPRARKRKDEGAAEDASPDAESKPEGGAPKPAPRKRPTPKSAPQVSASTSVPSVGEAAEPPPVRRAPTEPVLESGPETESHSHPPAAIPMPKAHPEENGEELAPSRAVAKAPTPAASPHKDGPHGKPSVPGRGAGSGSGPGAAPSRPGDHGSGAPGRAPVIAAPQNVPERPKNVTPAGPKLVEKQAVKLSGPKVVRIEAPEVVNAPRRRDGGSGGMGSRGPAVGTGAGSGEDEDGASRSPRRNTGAAAKKRGPGPGTGGGGSGDRGGVPARRRGLSGGKEESLSGGMWRPQDLAERELRLSRSAGFLKQRRQQMRKQGQGTGDRAATAAETGGVVHITAPFTIKDLSAATGVKSADIIKKLFMQGVMATVNSGIDTAKAQEVMMDFEIELEVDEAKTAEQVVSEKFVDRKAVDLRPRGPIVTILGHVDHGKTTLLDKIRNTNIAAGEAGGITQSTRAFRTELKIGGELRSVVFLDTPGHEAFTAMRARGAAITDVVVLVVSAPEGVMPQTIESINHARAAKVPIVVALNKIDRPDATPQRINQTLGELAGAGLNPIEWGGDTEVVQVSAIKGEGLDKLLEVLDLQGQMLELKADYGGAARGTVVEARVEEGRGPTADVIVQDGELKVGDFIVVGRAYGRVRDIMDDRLARHKTVGPASVVRISGFDALPDAGDKFYIVESLRDAQNAAEQRRMRDRDESLAQPKVTLDSLLSQMKEGDAKEILIVLKADVQGSVDVLKHEIEKVKTDEVKTRVLHSAVGGIGESDVLLADASKAVIIGFNVIPSGKARNLAEQKGVEIRTYQVIYEITDDLRKAAEGMLEPEMRTQVLGHAEVRKVFRISKVGSVAGCFVTDGVIERDALIRVTRNGIVVENDRRLEQLKRVKDDAKDVRAGLECGMKIVGYDDIKEGDVLECYKTVEVKRTFQSKT